MDIFSFLKSHGDHFTFPVSLANLYEPGNPLIYVNDSFQSCTGYDVDEILGRNCRFLQNGKGDPESRSRIVEALREKKAICQDLRNYRKNGELFFNRLVLLPLITKESSYSLGLQHEIPETKFSSHGGGGKNEILDRLINPISILLSLQRNDEEIFEKEFAQVSMRIKNYIFNLV